MPRTDIQQRQDKHDASATRTRRSGPHTARPRLDEWLSLSRHTRPFECEQEAHAALTGQAESITRLRVAMWLIETNLSESYNVHSHRVIRPHDFYNVNSLIYEFSSCCKLFACFALASI